jgi:hypothetical protein
MKLRIHPWGLAFVLLAGCRRQEAAKAPEAPVHNVVTDYVETRVQALDNARAAAAVANDKIHRMDQQAQSPQEP